MSQTRLPEPELAGDAPADDEDQPATGGGSARSALIVFLSAEVVALVYYMVISRKMWFFLDEWDFIAARTGGNLGDLFRGHHEHWVTVPVLVFRGLWWVFGLRTYRPYQLVIVLLHLGAAFLVRTVMRRVGVRPWIATVVAVVLVFFGSGYQNIVLPFQMTLVGSLVFGLVQLLLATHDGPFDRRDLLGLAAGAAGIMCSAVGVTMVVVVGIAVLIARGWRPALVHTLPLGALYVVWYEVIGNQGFATYKANAADVVRFVIDLLGATFTALGHYRPVGILLGAILVVGLVVAWSPLDRATLRRKAAMPLALLIGAVLLLVLTGIGRAGSSALKEKSRYLHLVAAMLLPALGVAADALIRRWRALLPVVLAALLVGIPGNLHAISRYMKTPLITGQARYERFMLSLPYVPIAKDSPRGIVPDPQLAHFVTLGWLLDGAKSGRIPKPHMTPADVAMDTLRLSFRQVYGRVSRGMVCFELRNSLVLHMERRQRLVIRAPNAALAITPPTSSAGDAYPFKVIPIGGSIMVATRPVTFRITNTKTSRAFLCSARSVYRAGRQNPESIP